MTLVRFYKISKFSNLNLDYKNFGFSEYNIIEEDNSIDLEEFKNNNNFLK